MADETKATAQSENTALTPEGHEPFDLPGEPDLPKCPTCKIGLLYTVAYDADALHEQGQTHPVNDPFRTMDFEPSGGSITLRCFNCDMKQTQALGKKEAA